MIEIISEHSVDLSLLPNSAVILDGGCRGFGFTDYFRALGHNVHAVDIDTLDRQDYIRCAIGLKDGKCSVNYTNDPQATNTKEGNDIDVYSIKSLHDSYDLIKLDIEGDEYEILKHSEHPMAKQLSIEFHAHCGKQTKEQLDELLTYLSTWYDISATWESRHGAGFNYWDVLFIAK